MKPVNTAHILSSHGSNIDFANSRITKQPESLLIDDYQHMYFPLLWQVTYTDFLLVINWSQFTNSSKENLNTNGALA